MSLSHNFGRCTSWIVDRPVLAYLLLAVISGVAILGYVAPERVRSLFMPKPAEAAVPAGGAVIVATFAEDGPTECSGVPVHRYSADELGDVFAAGFELVHRDREAHKTPGGAVQPFTWVILRRRAR